MIKASNKTALITGASSGIGRELAILFAKKKYNLVLIARNKEALENLKLELLQYQIDVFILIKDLSLNASYLEIAQELKNNNCNIEVLVNNAGIGTFGSFVNESLNSQLNIVNVNITAITAIVKIILPSMIASGKGHILNISSISGLLPIPNMSVYSASKAYNNSFSRSLNAELIGTGVCVKAICLGIVKTPLLEKSNITTKNARLNLLPQMTSQEAAQIVYNSMFFSKIVIIGGIKNKILVTVLDLLSKLFGIQILRYLRANS